MEEAPWKQLPFYKKIKYLAEIVAIAGGLFLIGLNVYQLNLFREQLKLNNHDLQLNKAQLKVNEKQLKTNEGELKLFAEQIGIERSKSEAQLECRMWRNFHVFLYETITISDSITVSGGNASSPNVTTEKNVVKAPPATKPLDEDRMEVVLMCRNRSPRPTAITGVFVRDEKGGELSGNGYNKRIELPFQIEPWGLTQKVFKVEKNDEKRIKDILVRDMEDNECILRPGLKWVKAKPGKM